MFLLIGSILVAALAGLLFGFDTAVIAGVTGDLTRVMALSSQGLGITVSSALWGTLIGALFTGWPGDRFGSRACLLVLALLYVVSGLGSALAPGWPSLLLFRFIAGIAIGGSSVLAPVYISEIFPTAVRARGQSLGSATHWLMNALIAGAFPVIAAKSEGAPFLFFAVMMLLQFVVVALFFPETNGLSLEAMQEEMTS
jgi:MFS family permease